MDTGRQIALRLPAPLPGRFLPPATLVSQMLAPGLAGPPAVLRRRALAGSLYAAGLRLAVRRVPPGHRLSGWA